jgi:Domain of unknown function (DUF2828)
MEWFKYALGLSVTPEDLSKSPPEVGFIFTENGAKSLATTQNGRIDLFFKLLRNTSEEKTNNLLERSWEESPLDTLKIIFFTRNCRGGKGERKQFQNCINWLIENRHVEVVRHNLENFPRYGFYKDLWNLLGTELQKDVISFYSQQLKNDLIILEHDPTKVTLAAKWAPSEGGECDKNFNIVSLLAKELGKTKAQYRKEILRPLRSHLRIVEQFICGKSLEMIDYSHVPSKAMAKYKKIFAEKDCERFYAFLSSVSRGERKMNVGQLFPHEIVSPFLNNEFPKNANVLEVQWKEFVRQFKEKLSSKSDGSLDGLAIVDVSGSMHGVPMQVAISLGMLLSEAIDSSSPYHGKLITFSESPNWFTIPKNANLSSKINAISKMNWGANTNLQKVFGLILNTALSFQLPKDGMPSTLWIFSDMQFDMACASNDKSAFEQIEKEYSEKGYTRPRIVFWNLRGDTIDFPVDENTVNTCLVSGFSPSLMELFLDGQGVDPYSYLRKAIDDPKYNSVRI